MITNDTIIKAAKAAGLDVKAHPELLLANRAAPFNPLHNDAADNAMIRRGAEIDVLYCKSSFASWVEARCYLAGYAQGIISGDKAKAEREAVILCAAAKFDAMNEGVR